MSINGDLVDAATHLARRWLASHAAPVPAATNRLNLLVTDPDGLDFAVRFVDDVARPADYRVAAQGLVRLATQARSVQFLSVPQRAAVRVGAVLAPRLPGLVVPIAKAALRAMVGHLLLDEARLPRTLRQARGIGHTLNINLLGEAVLGHREADQRRQRTVNLIRQPGVSYVSIKVSALAAQLVTWDLAGSVDRLTDRLRPLYAAARDHGVFINLDMEEYRDLALTTEVFCQLMSDPDLKQCHAGIALQAYLPDTLATLEVLTEHGLRRVAAGGVPIKVRLVKGANVAMERVEAELRGWPAAPYATKDDVDAHYLRLLDRAIDPDRMAGARIGLASHNLFHVAFGVVVARHRLVSHGLDIEMLRGMAPSHQEAIRSELAQDHQGAQLVLYTPVVQRSDFDVAISYLVRRLEENAAAGNFLHTMALLSQQDSATPMDAQEHAFRRAVARAVPFTAQDVTPRRRNQRQPSESGHFRNSLDTDPATSEGRTWAANLILSSPGPLPAEVRDHDAVDLLVSKAQQAAAMWRDTPIAHRAAALEAIAHRLEEARGHLVATMVHEPGKTIAEADPEVSEAVDFAQYYAGSARELDHYDGAHFTGGGVTLVTPPWNFPVAIPVGGVTAALAAGSAVIMKPASATPRCAQAAVQAIHAGLRDVQIAVDPEALVSCIQTPDREIAQALVRHAGISRVVLTGSMDTARLFAGWTPERPLFAETSGKNAMVVTPAADIDLAVADLVHSAFGHAGQKCSAASLVILVGSIADPHSHPGRRFYRQLRDAVESLAVGLPTDLGTQMGPLTPPAGGKLLQALTQLDDGESWLVAPKPWSAPGLAAGRGWTPGVKLGVQPGSWFHHTEVFGPVMGVMAATSLAEAVTWQNAVPFGLTGGIHSLDPDEIAWWLDRVEVGNAYVNRPITGAIVQRQPFGGWKQSSVGPGAHAGGPHYVAQWGSWADASPVPRLEDNPQGWLAWAQADDRRCWSEEFAQCHDPSRLRVEQNLRRYRPLASIAVCVGQGASPVAVQRVQHAAATAGVPVVVWDFSQAAEQLPALIRSGGIAGRIRLIGRWPGLSDAVSTRLGEVTLFADPVLASGRRELLTMLREQSLSITAHRYGHVDR